MKYVVYVVCHLMVKNVLLVLLACMYTRATVYMMLLDVRNMRVGLYAEVALTAIH